MIWHAARQIDQIGRRLLLSQSITNAKKIYSVFAEHTRWIIRGKVGVPLELGVPVSVIADHRGFDLNPMIMWDGSDVDYAVPLIEQTPAWFPNRVAVSFDQGHHSPANRRRLNDLLTVNALPNNGYLSKIERAGEQEPAFADRANSILALNRASIALSIGSWLGFIRMGLMALLAWLFCPFSRRTIHRLGLLILRGASKTVPRAA